MLGITEVFCFVAPLCGRKWYLRNYWRKSSAWNKRSLYVPNYANVVEIDGHLLYDCHLNTLLMVNVTMWSWCAARTSNAVNLKWHCQFSSTHAWSLQVIRDIMWVFSKWWLHDHNSSVSIQYTRRTQTGYISSGFEIRKHLTVWEYCTVYKISFHLYLWTISFILHSLLLFL